MGCINAEGDNCTSSLWLQAPSAVPADWVFRTLNQTEASSRCANQFWQGKLTAASPEVTMLRTVAFDYIMPTVWALGIFGNLVNLAVLRTFRGRTFVCLYWLAVSDLAALLLDMGTIVTVDHFRKSYLPSLIMCRLSCTYINLFICASNFIVVALTMERFYAVAVPMKARTRGFSGRPNWSIGVCFFLAIVLYLPSVYNYRLMAIEHSIDESTTLPSFRCYVCQWSRFQEQQDGRVYVCIREIFSRVIPVFIVVILNVGMVISLKHHQKSRAKLSECRASQAIASPDAADSDEDRLKRLLIVVMILFVVCNAPTVFRFLLMRSSGINELLPEIFVFCANLLALFNIACNFYVYCFCSTAVRTRVWELLFKVVPGYTTTTSTEKKHTLT